jgi:hypothetical protein
MMPIEASISMARAMAPQRPIWFEEPMLVDRPLAEWKTLAATSPIPLAGGENLRGADFDLWHEAGALRLYAGSDLSTDHLADIAQYPDRNRSVEVDTNPMFNDKQRALALKHYADFTPAPMSCEGMRCRLITQPCCGPMRPAPPGSVSSSA